MRRDVTMCIASVTWRNVEFFERALASVYAQTELPDVSVSWDSPPYRGAAVTRNRSMLGVTTEWLAFLDDDDELLPHHVKHLLDVAEETGADLVYPWHMMMRDGVEVSSGVVGRGEPFDPELLTRHNCIPPEVIVKRELVEAVGGFPTPGTERWPYPNCEDWGLWQDLSRAGAKIVHTPEITWIWHQHDQHTGGLPPH